MGKPSFKVYIDESGDEGFNYDDGSSKWFVLSAVITRWESDLETVKLVDGIRIVLKKPLKKPLHFRDLRHEHRLPYIDEISKADLKTVSVLVHKPSIKEPEKFQTRYRLYFYSVRYLLERVSWYCRDHRSSDDKGDGSAEVIFSNRSGMSYAELKKYLAKIEQDSGFFGVRIEWDIIRPDQILAYSAGSRMGLQIADAVASGFFKAVEPSRLGFTEDRYARMLKPVVFRHKNRYLGYGLKFFPREVDEVIDEEPCLDWVKQNYK